jgi:hypothetical protein
MAVCSSRVAPKMWDALMLERGVGDEHGVHLLRCKVVDGERISRFMSLD